MESELEMFMSRMRAALEAFNAGDYEAALAGVAPDVEWQVGDWVIDGGVLHSRDAAIEFFRRNGDAGDWTVTVTGGEMLEPGVVLVAARGTSTGRVTKIEGEFDFYQLYELGPNGVECVREFRTHEEALAAARRD